MKKYKCPGCGATCKTSYCYDCDKDIPRSCSFEDDSQSDEASSESSVSGYRCPKCGITWQIPYCHDCDMSISLKSKNSNSKWNPYEDSAETFAETGNPNLLLGVDNERKRFTINGEKIFYQFSDLISYELFENNVVIQESGVDRAVIGGLLFGEVGAIVGAQTRGSQNAVDSLYIRISLKDGRMKRIDLITSPTSRNGAFYGSMRKRADEIIAKLDSISAENKRSVAEENRKIQEAVLSPPQSAQTQVSPTLIADELLKLKQLLDMGVLTEEEFKQQKQKLLNQ